MEGSSFTLAGQRARPPATCTALGDRGDRTQLPWVCLAGIDASQDDGSIASFVKEGTKRVIVSLSPLAIAASRCFVACW